MKAILCRKPGRPDVLALDEIEKPSVTDDGVLVRVHAASVNPVDFFPLSGVAHTARWLSGGFKARPVVLGTDFAGTVESVGKSVTEFKPGDQVFGGKDRTTRGLQLHGRRPRHRKDHHHCVTSQMTAVVYDRYGPPEVLRLEQVDRPVASEGQVLVRVHATTVNRFDTATREANRKSGLAISLMSRLVSGVRGPRHRILGTEFAGEVDAVGARVTEFAIGDRVFGTTGLGFGAHAEYLAMPVSGRIAAMPAGMSFEEAAPICDGALNALTCLKQADLRTGRTILVNGASGAIGTAGVQLAKSFGADVTAVCNTKNLELVRSLGADRVIDYTQTDFTRNGQTYDVILDAVGKLSFGRCRGSLEPHGIFLPTDGLANLMWALVTPRLGGKKVLFQIPPRQTKEDVLFLKQLIEAGKYRPVIDRRYPLTDVVEATRYVETEQKTGNVVLTVSQSIGRS